jgi:hypothetical protein
MTYFITRQLTIRTKSFEGLLEAIHSSEPVSGLTHIFYRYPACFSPQFARAAIQAFTNPGELVLDPFMGGGTTLVEASVLGRMSIGLDINALSCFIANAKTTCLTDADIEGVRAWIRETIDRMNMHRPARRAWGWFEQGYQRNLSSTKTWPIRKSIELALDRIALLDSKSRKSFARAILLRTGQWALDCRSDVPSAAEFRERMIQIAEEMIEGAKAYRGGILEHKQCGRVVNEQRATTIILNRSADGIAEDNTVTAYGPPKLVLTSPPYPGVHVLYHRWQVLGRKETPAPFWITNSLDGNGESYYTFGNRKDSDLKTYFTTAQTTFSSLARIADSNTLFIQMLSFSDVSWQLAEYLQNLRAAGLVELRLAGINDSDDGRLWRTVPNRRWYAGQRGAGGASREVVLFHRKSC